MTDPEIFDSSNDYKPERNPYWYMRVYWWEGWEYVLFVLWSIGLFFLGLGLG